MFCIYSHSNDGRIFQGGRDHVISLPPGAVDLVVLAADDCQQLDVPFGTSVIRRGFRDTGHPGLRAELEPIAIGLAHEVAKMVAAGKRVLVTCRSGLNRSGLISAIAIRILTGASAQEAIDAVRHGRSEFALNNTMFEKIIHEWNPS